MRPRSVAFALLALAMPVPGQGTALARGRLIEGLRCQSDPTQTYTLYLPTRDAPGRARAGLIILDPRGRSVLAAKLFQEAAEEYGWVLLSSNDSRSDTATGEENIRALRALWPEIQQRHAVDPSRIFLAGFSGTAKFAWIVARSTGQVAGVIASGAGWEPQHFDQPISLPSYGTAGNTDFNYTPMREVHAQLREWGGPQRLEIFEGAHAWMPAALAREAIEWMEVQAMKRSLRPKDDALVARLLEQDLDRAAALEEAGRVLEAQRRYTAVADTFDGLVPVTTARREAARLEALPATRDLVREERRWDRYEQSMWERHQEGYGELRTADPPFLAALFIRRFGVGELNEHARAEGYEGVVGRRLLQTLATHAGYYLSRDLMRQGEHSRAAMALSVALEARPESPHLWYDLACARARGGSRGQALDALEKAVALGLANRELVASDDDLKSLRDEARFQALVAVLDEGGSPPP
jgi:dienelactone hydrolase